jgi:hypothetical protein
MNRVCTCRWVAYSRKLQKAIDPAWYEDPRDGITRPGRCSTVCTPERIYRRRTLPKVLNAQYLDRTTLSAAAFAARGPASCAGARAPVDTRPWRLPRDGIMAVRKTRLALKRGRLPQRGTLLNRTPTDELHKVLGCASLLPWCTSCSSARPRRRPPAGRRRCLCAELSGKTTTEASPVTDGAYFVRAPASQHKRWRRACLATKPKPIPLFCYIVRRP